MFTALPFKAFPPWHMPASLIDTCFVFFAENAAGFGTDEFSKRFKMDLGALDCLGETLEQRRVSGLGISSSGDLEKMLVTFCLVQ